MRCAVPPQVVLGTQLHIGADNGNLHGDEHRQRAHHKTEPKDVVEVALHDMNGVSTCPQHSCIMCMSELLQELDEERPPLVQHACGARMVSLLLTCNTSLGGLELLMLTWWILLGQQMRIQAAARQEGQLLTCQMEVMAK